MIKCVWILVALTSFLGVTLGGTKHEWKKRTIYQLLTDRFYRGGGNNSPCGNLKKYCGGTFKGIKEKLNYIKAMGFDAIWISPIPENKGDDYHGYGFLNMYKINPHFGTSAELKDLVKECHRQGIWVMLDVVANHVACVGKTDFSSVVPFNKPEHYHSYCQVDFSKMWKDRHMRENCRIFCLPDLNQDNPFVRSKLLAWIKDIIKEYGFDGIRIDTVPFVPSNFWKEYTKSAGVFQTGEVFHGSSHIVAEYQHSMDSLLNYPLYYAIDNAIGYRKSMYKIREAFNDIHKHFKDPLVLTTFIDNHDNKRFLNKHNDLTLLKNALVFILFAEGIPIVYYGTEQSFHGGADPNNREVLWTHMNTNAEIYRFLQHTIATRKSYKIWNSKHIERYVNDNVYFFTKGLLLICLTNSEKEQNIEVSYHDYHEGTKLCNIFDTRDCTKVENKKIKVKLGKGLPKIYAPAYQMTSLSYSFNS